MDRYALNCPTETFLQDMDALQDAQGVLVQLPMPMMVMERIVGEQQWR
jgi:hypothetical protein